MREKKGQMTFRLPVSMREHIEKIAYGDRISLSQEMVGLLELGINARIKKDNRKKR